MTATENSVDSRSDLELVAAAKEQDFGAFEVLVHRYRDRVYRLAFGMTKSATEAEEVVQDAFLNLFRNLDAFRGDSAPGTWIYRIAANSALMRMRTKRRKPLLALEDLQPGVANEPRGGIWPAGHWSRQPDDALLTQELRRRIEVAMDKLPEKYRLVLIMRDVEGLSNAEVADTLGLTVPTVKTRLHRARLSVRADLERYFRDK